MLTSPAWRSNLMFSESSFSSILLPALVIFAIISLIAQFYLVRGKTGLERELMRIRVSLIIGGCLILFLSFLLPSTPVLSFFGYPSTVADIDDPSKLLRYLQDSNNDLVRTTEILHLFMFIFVFVITESLYSLSKSVESQSRDS